MSDKHDEFGDRMKAYEAASKTQLINGTPKIARLDGRAWHTYLKSATKPYDINVITSLAYAAANVMKDIGGSARFAYIQSDETSIVINDKMTLQSEPWFNNQVQKTTSISSSVMTAHFNDYASKNKFSFLGETANKLAFFDSRFFQVPNIEEMTNAILWRQQDASKNSISQYARHYFSQKQLMNKNGKEMQEMMFKEHNFNWNDAPNWTKRGILVYKLPEIIDTTTTKIFGNYVIDWAIPKFSEDRFLLTELYKGI